MTAQYQSGTKTVAAVGDTWETLNSAIITTAGDYFLVVDASVMVAGDTMEIQMLEKPTGTGDTQRVAWRRAYANVQTYPLIFTEPWGIVHGADFQLRQRAGAAARAFKWSIRTP